MDNIRLSFLVCTKNRLPFVRILFDELFRELLPGEEIVVVDAGSTDGSTLFFETLLAEGRIHRYISEPDRGQAHGWNKAMLMARGIVLKKITDDDVHSLSAIRACANHMIANPAVDVILSNDLNSDLALPLSVRENTRLPYFLRWKNKEIKSFTFSDAHLLIRKSALAFTGLYDIGFTMLDWEFSLRLSYLRTSITWYTGFNTLNVAHPATVTSTIDIKKTHRQGRQIMQRYEYEGDHVHISAW